MLKFGNEIFEELSNEAQKCDRKRKNYNIHKDLNDPMQRLFNAIEPETYVRPHKHENPDKRELFTIVRGKAIVVEFDDLGNIIDFSKLSQVDGDFAVEISEKTWHTIIALVSGTIVLEIKDGPYDPIDDKNFAQWAPEEHSEDTSAYNQLILEKLSII